MERITTFLMVLIVSALTSPVFASDWTIGILALRGDAATRQHWQPLIDGLNRSVPNARFQLLPLDLNEMREAVNTGRVQFVLTNQAQFVQLNNHYHLRWLASLRSGDGATAESMATGSAILVRRDSPIQQPADLAGKTLGAVDAQAFGGYLLGYRELQKAGLQVDDRLTVRYMGFPADALLYLLRENAIQAAIVPVCLLENMDKEGLIDKRAFRPLLQKTSDFPCVTSTALYPDWSFAALPGVGDRIADAVARSLLNSTQSNGWRWGAPASTSDTEALLRALHRHPEQQRMAQTLLGWLDQHKLMIGVILLLLVVFIANYGWVMVLVQRRGKALEQANKRLREQQQTLERARQMSVLGEMASGFAHELNQPLSAIRMYAQGGLNHLSRPDNQQALTTALSHIDSQAERCGMIIKHLRNWAASESAPANAPEPDVRCDVAHTIGHVLRLLQLENIRVHHDATPTAGLWLPPILLEQVLANILLNAVQAGASDLWVSASPPGASPTIVIQDNAGGLTLEQQSNLFRPFHSSKKTGMGLGLVICQRLLRRVNGEIRVDNNPAPDGRLGVRVTLTFATGTDNENRQ
ncbi:tetrathionate respiration histidine kinase TtrS [Klebsiella oxytoca]|uniref:tetrathionate respiration histidine kinase TtrS n=1 Tax=Klebsiella oxytoca TaxID=571 RepID=UPI0020C1EC93|nr:tetrathionate respiration histidine kinase TtrS [Klebsiella oxytoca]